MATAHSSGDGAPTTGAAPALGLVLAGLAFAAAFLPWTGEPPLLTVPGVDALASLGEGSVLAALFGAVATVAFLLRRHGALDREIGAPIAAVGCLGVVGVALVRLVLPATGTGAAPSVAYGLPIAIFAALFGAGAAVADGFALSDEALWGRVRAVAFALGVGFVGFLLGSIVANLLALPFTAFGQSAVFSVATIGSGLGLGVFAALYLRYRGLGLDYLDVDWPTGREFGISFVGLLVLYGAAVAVSLGFRELGLPTATSGIEQIARGMDDPVFLLALVPLSLLAIGPGEELVYRNVVQKYLYEAFSRRTAVVVASVVFAAVHFSQYYDPNPVAMLGSLFVVFVLSLVLGYAYYRTENLVVPVLIHGTFNAVQFLLLYAQLTGMLPSVPT